MLITFERFVRFRSNFNHVHTLVAQIKEFTQKWLFLEIQDGGRRHIVFGQMLITFERFVRFLSNFNPVHI